MANIERQTATILQFPLGGRASRFELRETSPKTATTTSVEYSDLAFGGCWYHEDALHETDGTPGRKN